MIHIATGTPHDVQARINRAQEQLNQENKSKLKPKTLKIHGQSSNVVLNQGGRQEIQVTITYED